MPRVLNKKRDQIPSGAIYVGRPTKWGNPFTHLDYGKGIYKVNTVEEAVRCYEGWIRHQPELLSSLQELKGKDLVCWCAPGPCHANILIKLANQ